MPGRRRSERSRRSAPWTAAAASSFGPDGSPISAVKSPMIRTTVWPRSWNWRSLRSGTACPRCRSGAVGSTPSLMRSGRSFGELALHVGEWHEIGDAALDHVQLLVSAEARRPPPEGFADVRVDARAAYRRREPEPRSRGSLAEATRRRSTPHRTPLK